MSVFELQMGDVVFARTSLHNDGSIPGMPIDTLVAQEGARGVIVNIGHLEDMPEKELFLVRFEDDKQVLGSPIGCWPEEIRSGE